MTDDKPIEEPSEASSPPDDLEPARADDGVLDESLQPRAGDDPAGATAVAPLQESVEQNPDSTVPSDESTAIDPSGLSTSTTSADDSAGADGLAVRRWDAVRTKVCFIPGARQIADRQLNRAFARQSEQYFAKYDDADNASTRLPVGERARMPVVWLAEVFTPMTLPGLLDGIRDLAGRSSGIRPWSGDDAVERITASRRRGGGAWWPLPIVVPKGAGRSGMDHIEDQLPAGIASISPQVHSLTRTVTRADRRIPLSRRSCTWA